MKTHVFDIDGTILTTENLNKILAREFPGFNPETDFTDYSFIKSIQAKNIDTRGITADDIYMLNPIEIHQESPLTEGFLAYLQQIKDNKENYLFLTARRPSEIKYTEALFKKHNLEDDLSRVIYVGLEYGEPTAVQNDQTMQDVKHQTLLNEGYNPTNIILYEDRPQTCNTFQDAGSQVYLIDQTYNRTAPLRQGVTRIKNFTELLIKQPTT